MLRSDPDRETRSAADAKRAGQPARIEAHDDALPEGVRALRAAMGARAATDRLDAVSRHYVLRDDFGNATAALRVTHWTRVAPSQLFPLPIGVPHGLRDVSGTAGFVVSRAGPGDLARLIEDAWRNEYAAGGRLDLAAVRPDIAPLYIRLGYRMIGGRTIVHPRTGSDCRIMALVSGAISAACRLAPVCPSWEAGAQRAEARAFLHRLSQALE